MTDILFDESPCVEIRSNGNGTTSVLLSSPSIELQYIGEGFEYLPFPQTFYAPIGAILMQWGALEQEQDTFLKKLFSEKSLPLDKIPRGFERRRKLLKKQVRVQFPDMPELSQKICEILDDAKEIYPFRNILAHGQLSTRITISGKRAEDLLQHKHITVSVYGEGEEYGAPLHAEFTMASLRLIYCTISQLRAKFKATIGASLIEQRQHPQHPAAPTGLA